MLPAMNLHEAAEHFAKLGAVGYRDSFYPGRRVYTVTEGYVLKDGGLFSRHYFGADRLEIGYVIPDIGGTPHVLERPREWGSSFTLHPLKLAT
jgi:hypothetical protein